MFGFGKRCVLHHQSDRTFSEKDMTSIKHHQAVLPEKKNQKPIYRGEVGQPECYRPAAQAGIWLRSHFS